MASGDTYGGGLLFSSQACAPKVSPRLPWYFSGFARKCPKSPPKRSKRPKKRDFFIKTEITPCTCERSWKSSVFWIDETLAVPKSTFFPAGLRYRRKFSKNEGTRMGVLNFINLAIHKEGGCKLQRPHFLKIHF